MRMVNGVHSDTSNNGESFSESLIFEVEGSGLHDWLFVSSSTSNDSDGGSAVSVDGLSAA